MMNNGLPLSSPRLEVDEFFTIADFQEAYHNKSWGWTSGAVDCYGVKQYAPGLACYIHKDAGGYGTSYNVYRVPIPGYGTQLLDGRDNPNCIKTIVPNCVGYMQGRARELWGDAIIKAFKKWASDQENPECPFKGEFFKNKANKSKSYYELFEKAQEYLDTHYHLNALSYDAEQTVESLINHGTPLKYQVPFKIANNDLKHVSVGSTANVAYSCGSDNAKRDQYPSVYRNIDIYACQKSDFILDSNGIGELNQSCKPVRGALIVNGQKLISQSNAYGDDIGSGKSSMGHVAFVEDVLEDGITCKIGQSGWGDKLFTPFTNDPRKSTYYHTITIEREFNARIGTRDPELGKTEDGLYRLRFDDTLDYFQAYIYPPEECEFGGVSQSQFSLAEGSNQLFQLSNRIWVV